MRFHNSLDRKDSGVTEVVALVLITGFVLVVVVGILLVAGSQLTGQQTSAEVGQAEESLTQLDSEAYRAASGSSASQTVDLGLRANVGTLDVADDEGRITVMYDDFFNSSSDPVYIMDEPLGTIYYEQGDTSVGYQGGGVWRSDREGATMVSPPEIAFRNNTLTMSIVNTTRGGSIHSDVRLTPERTVAHFPNPETNQNLTNKVDRAQIIVTVESRYCEGWQQFFYDETHAILEPCDQGVEDRVSVMFPALPTYLSPTAGVIATSGPGEVGLQASSSYIDSYNSSVKPYDDHDDDERSDGIIKAAGTIDMAGGSEIRGDAHSGDLLRMRGGSYIEGDAYALDNDTHQNAEIEGEWYVPADTVPHIPPITTYVLGEVDRLQGNNDNDDTGGVISEDDELDIDQHATLDEGEYYLDTLELAGETLTLNVENGDITIGVERWIDLGSQGDGGGHIEVVGDGQVQFYVASNGATPVTGAGQGQIPGHIDEGHLMVDRESTIRTLDDQGEPTQRSRQVQLFGPENFVGVVAGNPGTSNVTTQIIAPAGTWGEGSVHIQHARLYGGVVTGNLSLANEGRVHFDRDMMDGEIPYAPGMPRLEYLYVTEHEIEVRES